MDEIEEKMNAIKTKSDPSDNEIKKYVRYLINAKKYSNEQVMEECMEWNLSKIETAIKEVELENSKPKPQRYYVSLKEPLED